MAINSLDIYDYKSSTNTTGNSNNAKSGFSNVSPCGLMKVSICRSKSKCNRKKNFDSKSPFMNEDVPKVPQIIDKTLVPKKGTEFMSSLPLAVNIYKVNSDDFRNLKNANRKPKKSVLTLPNEQTPRPQTCTVSDMNDSEYFNQDDCKKIRKRNPTTRKRKQKYEFYDKNARYPHMNIDLQCSSTDGIQSYANEKRARKSKLVVKSKDEKPNPHDVWAILRNINRFQFRPSLKMSDDSFTVKKKSLKKRNTRKDMQFVETCQTEEIAYISRYNVESRSSRGTLKSSSNDRITVIDKEHEFSQICQTFEKRFMKANHFTKGSNKSQDRNQNNKAIIDKNTSKSKNTTQKPNSLKTFPILYNKKKTYFKDCGDVLVKKDTVNYNYIDDKEKDVDLYNNGSHDLNKYGEEQRGQDFIYSGKSGSSKGTYKISSKDGSKKGGFSYTSKDFSNEFNKLSEDVLKSRTPFSYQQRKRQDSREPTNLHTDVPTPNYKAKLLVADIKRRLAELKFPIVVLGIDQLSSNYETVNTEPIQFSGLDKHIWPFMLQWQRNNVARDYISKVTTDISYPIIDCIKPQKSKRGMLTQKEVKNINVVPKIKHSNDIVYKRPPLAPQIGFMDQEKKPTPVNLFRKKILKLLSKKSSIQSFIGESAGTTIDSKIKHCTKNTDRDTRVRLKSKEVPRNPINSPVRIANKAPAVSHPWGKARWASEFIDNVIKKIKNGVYYNTHTNEHNFPTQQEIEPKEVEIPTIVAETEPVSVMQSNSKVTLKKSLEQMHIPGFDDSQLPALKIKILSSNQISVKHCVTNILVHFDVTLPYAEPVINLKKIITLAPLDVAGSLTKIFKCKTSIINSMLPAELCSILPKIMTNIAESQLGLVHSQIPLEKLLTQLSNGSQSRTEFSVPLQLPILQFSRLPIELQTTINGFYPRKRIEKQELKNINIEFYRILGNEMLPKLSRRQLFEFKVEPTSSMTKHLCSIKKSESLKNPFCKNFKNSCVMMKTFPATNRALYPAFKRIDLNSFLQNLNVFPNKNVLFQAFHYFVDKNVTINLTSINAHGLENRISLNIKSFMSDKTVPKNIKNFGTIKRDLPAIQCTELNAPSSLGMNENLIQNNKKKIFFKLYRKCKSSSNIPEKTLTSLNKITNIDDFFQAIGSSMRFAGIFDNNYSHKIMSSLKNMSIWITDINPTQALLVLLLNNKKDTPNLVRFKPLLLQGIAFNRITRANELDLEIEVIEREYLDRTYQYEGISFLSASPQNQDDLLEELCWIAKTTASDYQKTFDESSIKLLKSLLQKRKKLNPSYLRVMARYVGLGLLKLPVKKIF